MSSLPEEVQMDIFLKLPVESILNCRCVCKLWRKLIFSPRFIKSHLNLTTRDHHPSLVFKDKDSSIYSLDYASSSSHRCYNAVQLDGPSLHEAGTVAFDILGSCNGLICLGLYSAFTAARCNRKEINDICVWNPATGEYRKIPIRPHDFYHSLFDVNIYGFGYDSRVDDYKFVRIVNREYHIYSNLEVYTLGSGLWKTIENIPYSFIATRDRPGLPLNGALHWLGVNTTEENSFEVIVSFDTSNERLTDVSIPEGAMQHKYKQVGVLTDCLCLISGSINLRTYVWVMLDYGVKESWTKEFTLGASRYHELKPPLWIQNDKILMTVKNRFVSYNPKKGILLFTDASVSTSTKEHTKLKNTGITSYCYYVESLVSLNSGIYVKKRIVSRDRKKPKLLDSGIYVKKRIVNRDRKKPKLL